MSTGQSTSADHSAVFGDAPFWRRGTPSGSGCLEFQGSRDRQGYGRILRVAISRSPMQAHRYAYLLAHGSIPVGAVVRHSCDNPPCIRPEHLQLGSQADNIDDRQRRGRHRPGRMPGELHPAHKLTEEDVLELRAGWDRGWTAKDLGTWYGIAAGTAYSIVSGRLWKHLPISPNRRKRKTVEPRVVQGGGM